MWRCTLVRATRTIVVVIRKTAQIVCTLNARLSVKIGDCYLLSGVVVHLLVLLAANRLFGSKIHCSTIAGLLEFRNSIQVQECLLQIV